MSRTAAQTFICLQNWIQFKKRSVNKNESEIVRKVKGAERKLKAWEVLYKEFLSFQIMTLLIWAQLPKSSVLSISPLNSWCKCCSNECNWTLWDLVDSHLSFDRHVSNVCTSFGYIWALLQICRYLYTGCYQITRATVTYRYDYGSSFSLDANSFIVGILTSFIIRWQY